MARTARPLVRTALVSRPPPPPRTLTSRSPTWPIVAFSLAAATLLLAAAVLIVPKLLPAPPAWPAASAAPPAAPSSPTPPAEGDRTPEIRGRVLDADGHPVGGADVHLVSPNPPYSVYRETKTDGAGAFSLSHVHAARVRVVADRDPDGIVTSAELRMAEGQTTEITLVLTTASAV